MKYNFTRFIDDANEERLDDRKARSNIIRSDGERELAYVAMHKSEEALDIMDLKEAGVNNKRAANHFKRAGEFVVCASKCYSGEFAESLKRFADRHIILSEDAMFLSKAMSACNHDMVRFHLKNMVERTQELVDHLLQLKKEY